MGPTFMPKNSKPKGSVRQLKFAKAKVQATVQTVKMLFLIWGTVGLITATIFSLILSTLAGLNPPVAFLGSFVGCAIICVFFLPLKAIWRSKVAQICQSEGLWEEADQLVFEDAGSALEDILQGRLPREDTPNLFLPLGQSQLIFIRKGETRKALLVAEYLSRQGSDDDKSYQCNTLAALYIEIGRFEPGLTMLNEILRQLESEGRMNSPAYSSALLSKTQAYIDMHRGEECKSVLEKLRKTIESLKNDEIPDFGDRLVQSEAVQYDIDLAFHYFYSGRLKDLLKEEDPEPTVRMALEIMKNESYQKVVTLLYAEILLWMAGLKVRQGDFKKAEGLAKETLAHYENKTRYKGPDYHRARATLAYARLKQGYSDVNGELNGCLKKLDTDYEPIHPSTATILTWIADSYVQKNDFQAAKDALERALSIRKTLFAADDTDIAQIQELLDSKPELQNIRVQQV